MTNLIKILGVLGLAAAAACSSSDNSTGTGTTGGSGSTTGGTTGGGIPAAPALKSHQIDRMGRGAVNTALTAPLNSYTLEDGGTIPEPTAKDLYNSVDDPTQWPQFVPAFAASLAVYDSLDATCGNQILAKDTDGGTNQSTYGALAGVLADDELYVDTSVQTCTLYLAAELEAIGAAPPGGDCGGRTLSENIIDETYSALAIGKTTGVMNGITAKAGSTATATFPFLGTP